MTFHLYLDSADAADWRSWLPTRVFRGVTTNPTLMQRAGRPVTAGGVAQVLTELGPESGLGPALSVQVQAWGDTAEDMVALADAWGASARPIVKLPATQAGFGAAAILTARGVPVTITAVYSAAQTIPALAVGASYIAPYVGRIEEAGGDPARMVAEMAATIAAAGAKTRILLASVRTLAQLSALTAAGATAATLSPKLASDLMQVPETLAATAAFDAVRKGEGVSP